MSEEIHTDTDDDGVSYLTTIDRAHAEIARLDATMRALDLDGDGVPMATQIMMGLALAATLSVLAAAEAVIDLSIAIDADPGGRHAQVDDDGPEAAGSF